MNKFAAIGKSLTNDDELELEVVEDQALYPWTDDDNEKRRAFIFEFFNFNPDIHIDAQLQQLKRIEQWLSGR